VHLAEVLQQGRIEYLTRFVGELPSSDEWLQRSNFLDPSTIRDFERGIIPDAACVDDNTACVICARVESTKENPILLCDGGCTGDGAGSAVCFECSGLTVRAPLCAVFPLTLVPGAAEEEGAVLLPHVPHPRRTSREAEGWRAPQLHCTVGNIHIIVH
jgi:hypothetical protein